MAVLHDRRLHWCKKSVDEEDVFLPEARVSHVTYRHITAVSKYDASLECVVEKARLLLDCREFRLFGE